jgi:hypothetical protein
MASHAPWDATAAPGGAPDNPSQIGGGVASAPEAVSWGPGRIDIFAVGTDGRMRHQAFAQGGGWMVDWESLGGVFYEPPDEWSL